MMPSMQRFDISPYDTIKLLTQDSRAILDSTATDPITRSHN
jgi:hypothetical protein